MQVRQNHRRSDRLTARHRAHLTVKRPGGNPPPSLDLDGEIEMKGGEERGAENQSDIRLENTEEPTLLTDDQENVIDMQERGAGVKRGQSECVDSRVSGKLRRREGIKRELRDITPVNYEEYDPSWDLEDQSKKCKMAVNCLLAGCGCKVEAASNEPIRRERGEDTSAAESSRSPTPPVHVITGAAVTQGKQAGTRGTAVTVPPVSVPGSSNNPSKYNDTLADPSANTNRSSSNATSDTISHPTRNPRSRNRSWSGSLYHMGLMIILMFVSVTVTEGVMDWRESPHPRYVPDCKLQPLMYSYPMPREGLFLFNDIKRNLTRKQGVRPRTRECNHPKIGDMSHVAFWHERARAIHHHADVRGPRVRGGSRDQHGTKGSDVVPQGWLSLTPWNDTRGKIRMKPGADQIQIERSKSNTDDIR